MTVHGPLYTFLHPSRKQLPSRALFLTLNVLAWVVSAICIILAVQWIGEPFRGFLFNERMEVADFGVSSWTGIQAGLKRPDKVIAVNGRPVRSTDGLAPVIKEGGLPAVARVGREVGFRLLVSCRDYLVGRQRSCRYEDLGS